MPYKKMLAVAIAAACAGLAGCENTAQGVKEDAKENTAAAERQAAEAKANTADERAEIKQEGREAGAAIGEAGRDLGDAAVGAGRAIGNAAEKAGDKIAGAANNAGAKGDAAQQTLDVKTALQADSTIDATRIDVDTDASTKTVTLKGTVATAAQKASAERIARSKAPGYKIRNSLTVTR